MMQEAGYSGKSLEPKTILGQPCDKMSLHEAIDCVIKKFPKRIAVSFKSKSLTYEQLDSAADELADLLISQGIGHADSIAILMHRSEKMVVALLAALRVGACYVPIDPSYPEERINFILEDTGARALVLGDSAKYAAHDLSILVVTESDVPSPYGKKEASLYIKEKNDRPSYRVGDLAYIIYTSGSTGLPKGVQVTHSNVHNYAYWAIREFGMDENDVIDFSSTLAFDISVRATIVPLLAGARIQICTEQQKELPQKYIEFLSENEVSLITVTPSYFGLLNKLPQKQSYKLTLRKIWLIGEPSTPSDVKSWMDCFPRHELVNEYGPTEATVGVLAYKIADKDIYLDSPNIPVGIPAYNTTIYILDKDDKPCSRGDQGQICISGKSVSNGYLNRAELNSAAFISNPLEPSEKIYKTGDIGRILEDGNIEHLGRLDRQVKVRGFRFELGEIDNTLMTHVLIHFATTSLWEQDGETKVIAYLVLAEGKSVGTLELRKHLQKTLPDYMVPNHFFYLDKVPLTLNGKIDRAALPAPEIILDGGVKSLSPENDTEKTILDIWHLIFGKNYFGVTDNFFFIGGESFNAAQIVRMIEDSFSIDLALQDFYTHPSVRELSNFISRKQTSTILDQEMLLSALSEIESMSDDEITEELKK